MNASYAKPARRGASLARGGIAKDVVHRFDRFRVEEKNFPVFQNISVASIECRLDFDGGDFLSLGVENVVDVKISVSRVFDFDERQYRAHRVRYGFQFFGEIEFPAPAS